ncbi:MAG: PQQ-like beta-propeller repeat protein [Verrucomicrobiae bacterium]|nr:PQQ-like beta-propeller repeat protein [Verrucomicrobiae bacterium]
MTHPQRSLFKGLLPAMLLVSTLGTLTAPAADWPMYRGPRQDGISPEKDWRTQWPEGGPPVAWKAEIGTGFCIVSVSQGRVYTMGNKEETDLVYCFDEASGKELWRYSYPCKLDPRNFEGGPCATPTVAGGRVYTFSRFGHLHALDAATGKVVWSKNVMEDAGAKRPTWGFSGSVLIEGNLAIVNAGKSGMAFHKDTGALVWKSEGTCGYSTPVPFNHEGTRAVALFSASSVLAVAVADGRVLWEHPWKTDWDVNAADPIIVGNKVFISSGYNRGCALLEVKGNQVRTLWENKNMRNHFANCVLVGDYLYGFDGQTGGGSLKCLDFRTGETKWSQSGLTTGGLMVAGGKLVGLGDRGRLFVAEATPEGYRELARANILDSKKCWTMPVLVNGRLYARNNSPGDLVVFDVRAK